MFGVETISGPAVAPVDAAELRARLRLNDPAEDAELAEFLAAAVERFEADAGRPVLPTSYRQDLSAWPSGAIVLGRGGVSSITAVKKYLADGSTETLAASDWRADLATPPARVYLASVPATLTTSAGIPVSPVGAVEFVAGWPNAAAVPKLVRTALMLLAAHYYENREAFKDSAFEMRELPLGWRAVVAKYKLGVSGDWGQ